MQAALVITIASMIAAQATGLNSAENSHCHGFSENLHSHLQSYPPGPNWTNFAPRSESDVPYQDLALSPDGDHIYSAYAGALLGAPRIGAGLHTLHVEIKDTEYSLAKISTQSGCREWEASVGTGMMGTFGAFSVEVSPNGDKVFATGVIARQGMELDAMTAAFDAATGDLLWSSVEQSAGTDFLMKIVLSIDGRTAFAVGGWNENNQSDPLDLLAVAYDTSTGNRIWRQVFDYGFYEADFANAALLSSDGSTLYVAGAHRKPSSDFDWKDVDYLVTSIDAESGEISAKAHFDYPGDTSSGDAYAHDIIAASENQILMVAGNRGVVAVASSTLVEQWRSPVIQGFKFNDMPYHLALVEEAGIAVFAGTLRNGTSDYRVLVQAITIDNGEIVWQDEEGLQTNGAAMRAVASGGRVFVVGYQSDGEISSAVLTEYSVDAGNIVARRTLGWEGFDAYGIAMEVGAKQDVYISGIAVAVLSEAFVAELSM